jgi:hypothetical protein
MRRESQYKEFADECRQLAPTMKVAEHERVLQEMAASWNEVAKEPRPGLGLEETDHE